MDSDFIAALKQRNVTLIPTLIRDEFSFAYGDAPAWIDDPFFQKFVPPERLAVLKTKIRDEQLKNPQRALIKAGFEMNQVNLKKLSDGGVRIALGTDSGGAATASCPGLFRAPGDGADGAVGADADAGDPSPSRRAQRRHWASTKNSAPWPKARPPTSSCWRKIRSTTSPTCGASRPSIWAAKSSSRAPSI